MFISGNSLKLANIGELPYGVYVTAPKFGLREETECVLVLMSSKQRRKRKFNVDFRTSCKEKRAAREKFVVFHLLIGLVSIGVLIAVAITVAFVVAPRIYRCA